MGLSRRDNIFIEKSELTEGVRPLSGSNVMRCPLFYKYFESFGFVGMRFMGLSRRDIIFIEKSELTEDVRPPLGSNVMRCQLFYKHLNPPDSLGYVLWVYPG